jgi:hypothetical protein
MTSLSDFRYLFGQMKCPSTGYSVSTTSQQFEGVKMTDRGLTIMETHAINPAVVLAYLSGRKYMLEARPTAADVNLIAALPKMTARATYQCN